MTSFEIPPTPKTPELDPSPESMGRIQAAYHDVRATIARRGMDRAGATMERMDHKDALYADIGSMVLTGELSGDIDTSGEKQAAETVSGRPAKPRTLYEKFIDSRIDRKLQKKQDADILMYRKNKIFGNSHTMEGVSTKTKKDQNRKVNHLRPRGHLTAREARIEKNKINAQPMRLGQEMHNRMTKTSDKANRKLKNALDSPAAAHRRNRRREKAIERIKKYHRKAEEHRSAASRV